MNVKYNIIIFNVLLSLLFIYVIVDTGIVYFSSRLNTVKKYAVNRIFTKDDKSIDNKFNFYKIIEERNLFCSSVEEIKEVPQPKTVQPPPKPEIKVESKPVPPPKPLNLKLKGTIVGISENSFAIIENTARRIDEFYRINDIIKDSDAKIIDIARNIVTLQIGDRIEYLTIYEEDKKNIGTMSQRSDKKTDLSGKKPHPTREEAALAHEQGKTFVVNRSEMLGNMGGDVDQVIEKIMASVDINPYIENGKFVGYSLNNLESVGNILTGQGFQNGDIIKEINGIKLESPEKLFELYQVLYPELQSIPSIQVVLDRGGSDITLNYQINQ